MLSAVNDELNCFVSYLIVLQMCCTRLNTYLYNEFSVDENVVKAFQ